MLSVKFCRDLQFSSIEEFVEHWRCNALKPRKDGGAFKLNTGKAPKPSDQAHRAGTVTVFETPTPAASSSASNSAQVLNTEKAPATPSDQTHRARTNTVFDHRNPNPADYSLASNSTGGGMPVYDEAAASSATSAEYSLASHGGEANYALASSGGHMPVYDEVGGDMAMYALASASAQNTGSGDHFYDQASPSSSTPEVAMYSLAQSTGSGDHFYDQASPSSTGQHPETYDQATLRKNANGAANPDAKVLDLVAVGGGEGSGEFDGGAIDL